MAEGQRRSSLILQQFPESPTVLSKSVDLIRRMRSSQQAGGAIPVPLSVRCAGLPAGDILVVSPAFPLSSPYQPPSLESPRTPASSLSA